MTNAMKGALLSGLVFPGLGQLVLKRYRRGVIIMLAVLISLSVYVIQTVQEALAILEQLETEGGVIDMTAISNAATLEPGGTGDIMLNILLWFVLFCWIAGTVDAYRIGRKKDLAQGTARAPGGVRP